MRHSNWVAWVWAIAAVIAFFAPVPASADPVEATISLGRDPEPPFCVMNPGGTVEITWSIEYSTTPLRVYFRLTDPTETIILDEETYPGSTGINVTRYWTVPAGLVDGKYWIRVEYWSLQAGNEANAEVTFYVCSEVGNLCAQKFQDTDCDELLTPADLPLADWYICLDTPYDETICLPTDANGQACWTGIAAGEYRVWEFVMPGWRAIGPTEYFATVGSEPLSFTFFNTQCAPPSACCFPDGHCEVLAVGTCAAMGGVVYPDPTCETVACPQPEFACCFPDGHCEVLTEADCVAGGGTLYPEYTSCADISCPQPPYACCLPLDENCYMLTEADCLAQGGIWHDGMVCSDAGGDFDCPLYRVCCVGLDCFILTEADCLAMGGQWHPEWTTCEPVNPCIPSPVVPDSWGAIKGAYR